MKYLFVGGPYDGKREEAEGKPVVKMHELLPIKFTEENMLDLNQTLVKEHWYCISRFVCGKYEPHAIYVHSSLEETDLMDVLLTGYKA